jgi:hypothetical protein
MPPLAYFGIESTGVTLVVDLLILFAVLLYLALVYWTYVDSRRRIADPMLTGFATAVSLIPYLGTLLYLIVRPTESLEDARERELELETTKLRLHELESSLCPHCDYPLDSEYVRCPSCLRKLKDRCTSCSRPLDRTWTICPYCETEVPNARASARRSGKRGARQRAEHDRDSERAEGKPSARPAPAPTHVPERGRPVPASGAARDSAVKREPQPASTRGELDDSRGDTRGGGHPRPASASGTSSGI